MAKIFFIVLLTVITAPAVLAKNTGDLFEDQGIAVQNRPVVDSDRYYGYRTHPDMFRESAPYVRTNKDMFDFIQPPPNPGIERHFSAHPGPSVPDYPLFHNPNIPND